MAGIKDVVILTPDGEFRASEVDRIEIDLEINKVAIVIGGFCERYDLDKVVVKVEEKP